MSMMATSPAQPQTQHQPIPSSSSSTTSALSPSLPTTTADAPPPITRSTSVKFKDQVSPREQQQQQLAHTTAHPQQQTPEVHVNGSPLKKGPIQRTPKSSLQGQGQDEAAWGKNFWVTLVDPQVRVFSSWLWFFDFRIWLWLLDLALVLRFLETCGLGWLWGWLLLSL